MVGTGIVPAGLGTAEPAAGGTVAVGTAASVAAGTEAAAVSTVTGDTVAAGQAGHIVAEDTVVAERIEAATECTVGLVADRRHTEAGLTEQRTAAAEARRRQLRAAAGHRLGQAVLCRPPWERVNRSQQRRPGYRTPRPMAG